MAHALRRVARGVLRCTSLASRPCNVASRPALFPRASCVLGPPSLTQPLDQRRHASFHEAHIVSQAAQKELPDADVRTLIAHSGDDVVNQEALVTSARFLHRTLPMRLARRIVDIHNLPYICGINPHIQTIHDLYVWPGTSFDAFRHCLPLDVLVQSGWVVLGAGVSGVVVPASFSCLRCCPVCPVRAPLWFTRLGPDAMAMSPSQVHGGILRHP